MIIQATNLLWSLWNIQNKDILGGQGLKETHPLAQDFLQEYSCQYFEPLQIIPQSTIMNRIIKMQEEEYPLSSPSYDNVFFNHCLTTFYDQDSNEDIIQARCSTQEVMFYLENNIDLCDTPLQEILRFVEVNLAFKGVDLDLLRRKILKQKSLLKRNRAKNRKNTPIIKKTYSSVVAIADEDEEETKKQRNRISAQISRDKKKLRVRELEEMNKKLQEECNMRKLQNDQLKQTMIASKPKSEVFTSKISKMLIFLGIICLFGIIKDLFCSNKETSTPISKITEPPAPLALKKELAYLDHSDEKGKMLEIIEAPLLEMFEDASVAGKLKEKIRSKLNDWTGGMAFVPDKLKKEIEDIRLRSMH